MSYGSCIIMNTMGDVTISWDKESHDEVVAQIQTLMDKGIRFFKLVSKDPAIQSIEITRKDKIEGDVIIRDDDFNELIEAGILYTAKTGEIELETSEILTKPEEVVNNNTIAVKPLVGG